MCNKHLLLLHILYHTLLFLDGSAHIVGFVEVSTCRRVIEIIVIPLEPYWPILISTDLYCGMNFIIMIQFFWYHNQLAKNKHMNQKRRMQEGTGSTQQHHKPHNNTLRDAFRDSMDAGDSTPDPEPGRPSSGGHWDGVPWLESRAFIYNLDQRPSPRVFITHFKYDMMSTGFFKVKPRVCYAAWSHTSSLRKDINQWKCPCKLLFLYFELFVCSDFII